MCNALLTETIISVQWRTTQHWILCKRKSMSPWHRHISCHMLKALSHYTTLLKPSKTVNYLST